MFDVIDTTRMSIDTAMMSVAMVIVIPAPLFCTTLTVGLFLFGRLSY